MKTRNRLQGPGRVVAWLCFAMLLTGCGGGGQDASIERREGASASAKSAEGSGSSRSFGPGAAEDQARVDAAALPSISPSELFDWAERAYPALFPGHQANQTFSPYVYRYYPESGNYLGLTGGSVVVLGPISNGTIATVGKLTDFACLVKPAGCGSAISVTRIQNNVYFSSASKLLLLTKFCYEFAYADKAELTMTGATGFLDGKIKFSNGNTCDVNGAYSPSAMKAGSYSSTLTLEDGDIYSDSAGNVVWMQSCNQYVYYDRSTIQLTYGGGSAYASGAKIGSVVFSNNKACNLLGIFSLAKLV